MIPMSMGLGEGGRIGVVMQDGRPAQARIEPFDEREVLPPVDLIARHDQAPPGIDRTAESDSHAGDLVALWADDARTHGELRRVVGGELQAVPRTHFAKG